MARAPLHRRRAHQALLYTGVRVAELVAIRLAEVDLDACRIRISRRKAAKTARYPFLPPSARRSALHIDARRQASGAYQFEFQLAAALQHPRRASDALPLRRQAGLDHHMPPHRLRHFLFRLESQGIDDALIQPYSGHASRQSLEICSRLALTDAQDAYNETINRFPVSEHACRRPRLERP